MKSLIAAALILFMLAPVSQSGDTVQTDAANLSDFRLLSTLYEEYGQFAFSPMSLKIALMMAAEGADGETRAELLAFLMTDELTVGYNFARYPELKAANAAIVSDHIELLESYTRTLADKYQAELMPMDADVVGQVNRWANEHTDGMIPEFLTERPSDSLRMMLLNALVLDAKWSEPFSEEATYDQVFHAPGGDVRVPLMHQTRSHAYAEVNGVQAVKLPYDQSKLELLVILPKKDGMKQALEGLGKEGIGWLGDFRWEDEVVLTLPKLSMQASLDIKQVMQDVGVTLPFTLAADFSGMTGSKEFFISAIVQKVRLDMDEERTKAAAVTAISVAEGAAPQEEPERIVMTVDRPYILLLQDRELGVTLFAAVITDPSRT